MTTKNDWRMKDDQENHIHRISPAFAMEDAVILCRDRLDTYDPKWGAPTPKVRKSKLGRVKTFIGFIEFPNLRNGTNAALKISTNEAAVVLGFWHFNSGAVLAFGDGWVIIDTGSKNGPTKSQLESLGILERHGFVKKWSKTKNIAKV